MNILIIGGGHNGLAAAFYLAKAGLKPIVLEQSETVGGGAITGDLHRGFRCPALAHHVSIRADVVADMQLARHGVEFLSPAVDVCAPALEGPAAVIYGDASRTAQALRAVHGRDADAYEAYRSALWSVCRVLSSMLTAPAPDIDHPDARDLWNLFKTGRHFRALGKKNSYRLLRWAPMPVADLASEWFESEVLRALIAGPALSGMMFGPRSAGSALVLLLHEANRLLAHPASRVRGGPGVLTRAMAAAARDAGADIQTGVRVDRILVRDDRVVAVTANGREIAAATVVSAVDPKTTFLQLVDPGDVSPDFLSKIRNYRAAGTVAKVNLALSGLPAFTGPANSAQEEYMSGRIHIGPDLDYLERAFDHAKYGEMSEAPWLDVTIPSIVDAGLAPDGAHVMSIYAHYAPYRLRDGDWARSKPALLKRVLATLERFAPGLEQLVLAADVITPAELESRHGFHGGHIFHGELSLDQLVSMRPLLGYSRYHSPLRGLFLCGGGTHPGGFMSAANGKIAAGEIVRSLRS